VRNSCAAIEALYEYLYQEVRQNMEGCSSNIGESASCCVYTQKGEQNLLFLISSYHLENLDRESLDGPDALFDIKRAVSRSDRNALCWIGHGTTNSIF